MKEYSAILIGNGTMGKRHCSRFEACGVRFLKVLDLDAEQWLHENETCFLNGSLKIDFAVIASPATTHYDFSKFFLTKSVPVFVEKPLAVTAEQSYELQKLAEQNNTTLFVAQSECFNPIFLNFRKHFFAELALCRKAGRTRMEFRREHGYTERCRDVDVSLDILVHDLSMFLTMFDFDDIQVVDNKHVSTDRSTMTLKVCRGPFAGLTADFIADRNSANDVRTISVDFDGSEYSVSLARYLPSGDIAHIPDSLDNEHKFFLKLLAGACGEWGRRAARIAAQVVELATLP